MLWGYVNRQRPKELSFFTLDYAQYSKKQRYFLAGTKIVDRGAINPKDVSLSIADGKNVQGNEERSDVFTI